MTLIVAVLNKHAVAIAADSAVTMGNTHKVVNSANKIFTLSKYHPVAVMTYNNAAFMGVPWDIIIKEYRKDLKECSFPLLENYVTDFLRYLHKRNFFCDEKTQMFFLIWILDKYIDCCIREIKKNLNIEDVNSAHLETRLQECLESNKNAAKCPEFEVYRYDDFLKYSGIEIKEYAKSIKLSDKKVINATLLTESFYYYFIAKFSDVLYTGLVFVGYGDNEIYPSIMSLHISIGIDGHLKYHADKTVKISDHGIGAAIIPFAQTDVTQTIMNGINPSFQNIISNVINKSIKHLPNTIADVIDELPDGKIIADAVRNIDMDSQVRDITLQISKEMQETYTEPLISTVSSLDKEDMANMAESFISLTSLVRRMQPVEETVGGPVDVAVISKGDGFVWINRKHYFKPELNAQFFNNYFK